MIAIAFLFVCVLCDCFKSRRRLEAEILVLRHPLNVLQQHAPRRLPLRWADRTLFIREKFVVPGTSHRWVSDLKKLRSRDLGRAGIAFAKARSPYP